MFKSYKITGLKLEYRPYFFGLGASDVVMREIICGTKMAIDGVQPVPVPLSEFRASLDAKSYDPMKPFKRYYHVSKWARGVDIGWRTCANAVANVYGNNTLDCMTSFNLTTVGFANGGLVGSIRVTYYAKFKDRQSD